MEKETEYPICIYCSWMELFKAPTPEEALKKAKQIYKYGHGQIPREYIECSLETVNFDTIIAKKINNEANNNPKDCENHGYWKFDSGVDHCYKCSICNQPAAFSNGFSDGQELTPYCPQCGAEMNGNFTLEEE